MNLLEMLENDLNDESKGGNDRPGFTKFGVGDTYITVLAITAPRWTHFLKAAGNLTVNCPGNGCPVCNIIKASKKAGADCDYKSAKKYGMLIFNHNTNEIEILDQKITFIKNFKKMLADLREDAIDKAMEKDEDLTEEAAAELIDASPGIYDPSQFTTKVTRS